ncbi:amino acid/polyamine/organocation transporter, APC superfamily [Metallosphaera sedula]|uniref:Amino acid/polyamine/organocation transporter, APC superfamily n=3 Tax=Metallosphaera TaxID=41980 RepID=A4YFA5_METS5|nr:MULTISPECIES: APC family permease [Metallosphaera]ABP95107.1 amino acid/polyamine/organocation transporter, APC superfamily [Metallosphaera sedula DSM 5348]AIM27093.1 amino acid/polyamine/organocation transporter, APC superfamily [Metallosphaera sedula]MCY0861445.1 APC family permease [Metallosphaera prunae]WPX07127.1 APC family permease [Metallosphaera sedula DSM 5348]
MNVQWLKREVLHFLDLVPMSTSSVAPAFSIAAAYGSMVALVGPQAIMSVVISFPFFLMASLIFRKLNRVAPHCGASYHWGSKFMGKRYGGFQFWIITLAYFLSLPPIIIPAGEYTLDLLYRLGLIARSLEMSVFWDSIVGMIWAILAAIPLVLGVKPTARTTEAFLLIELIVMVSFIVIGLISLPFHTVNKINLSWFFSAKDLTSLPLFLGLAASMVIVATILDGWEIDSYASEESKRPTSWPGSAGVIGLISVFLIYMVVMPLMTIETPLSAISSSVDPLARWASYVIPNYAWAMDIAIICSTASSLWLTAFILSRVWYSASREGLLPYIFGRLNKYGSPWVAVVVMTSLEILVQGVELGLPSVDSLFGIVLTGAGAFLLLEFAMDSITVSKIAWEGRIEWYYRILAPVAAGGMLFIVIMGIIDAGPAFGIPADIYALTISVLIVIGGIYFSRRGNRVNTVVAPWLMREERQGRLRENDYIDPHLSCYSPLFLLIYFLRIKAENKANNTKVT